MTGEGDYAAIRTWACLDIDLKETYLDGLNLSFVTLPLLQKLEDMRLEDG